LRVSLATFGDAEPDPDRQELFDLMARLRTESLES